MKAVLSFCRTLFKREEGQALSEYGLILALIAAVVVAVLTLMGQNILAILQAIADAIGGAV